MKKLDIAILLCPGNPRIKDDFKIEFPDLSNDSNTGRDIYLGGTIRMRGALYLWKRKLTKKFIVVGGSKHKIDCMKQYLKDCGVPDKDIIRIKSDPDTLGNLRAIKKVLEKSGKLKDFIQLTEKKKVGLSTNDYHIRRALLFTEEIFFKKRNQNFVSLIAEKIVLEKRDFRNKLLKPEKVFAKEYKLRVYREQRGYKDWKEGVYRDQHKTEEEWEGKSYDSIESLFND